TIVPSLQRVARSALGSHQGAVVALDPGSGDVLAMYSNPGYDPNPISTGTDEQIKTAWNTLISDPQRPLVSKAFQELYLPGSTFKLVTASAALENGWGPDKTWPNPHVLNLPQSSSTLQNFGNEICHGGTRRTRSRARSRRSRSSCRGTAGGSRSRPTSTRTCRRWPCPRSGSTTTSRTLCSSRWNRRRSPTEDCCTRRGW
ncbi:MAG: hypothetical protein E6G54_05965, partial [Actinobacteria bacterium]